MKQSPRVMSSEFMPWARKRVQVKYNLAASGVASYPLAKLPVKMEDLEITGTSTYGYKPLLDALAKKCNLHTDHIFSTIGTSLANHIAMAVLLQPGDEVLIEHPTYELLLSTAQYLGATVKRFPRRPENNFRISPEDIKHSLTKHTRLIVLTNLHNPSSALTGEETLKEIGEIAQSVGARVLVDEVYLDAAVSRSPQSAIDLGKHFVVTNSLTKVYGLSGLRCGWVLAEPYLIQQMWHLNDLFEVNPPHATDRMSVIALKHLDQIGAWARTLMKTNQLMLTKFLADRTDIEGGCPEFGTVAFLRLKHGSVDELGELLERKYETAIAPGRFFEMPDYFRLGLGCQSEIFEKGLKNFSSALQEIRKGK